MLKKLFRLVNIPAYLFMVIIIILLTSSLSGVKISLFENQDKVMHFIAFMPLSFSFSLWIRKERWEKNWLLYLFVVLFATTLFGAFTEYCQSFIPGRSTSFADGVADFFGALVAVSIYVKFKIWNYTVKVFK